MPLLRSLLLLPLFPALLYSQDSLVVLSPLVGPVIDSAEAARYGVLKAFPRLHEATFRSQGGERYEVRVVQETASGLRDTTFTISAVSVRNIHARIHHRNALEAGTYDPNGDDCQIARVAQGQMATAEGTRRMTLTPGFLFEKGPPLDDPYPRFHFGVGLTQIAPTVNGMEETVRWVEDYYRNQGYTISHKAQEPSLSPLFFLYDVGIAFGPEFDFVVEAGQRSQEGDETKAAMWYASASLLYTPSLLSFGYARFGVGVSAFRWAQELKVTYSYYEAVSPIGPNGGFSRLETIDFNAGDSRWGGSILMIGEFLLRNSPHLTVYLRYTLSSAMEAPVPQGVQGQEITITLEGISAGLRLNIYL